MASRLEKRRVLIPLTTWPTLAPVPVETASALLERREQSAPVLFSCLSNQPAKRKRIDEETDEKPEKRKKQDKLMKETYILTNAHRVEDKVIEGEEITEFEIITTDWDKVLEEHRIRLETEAQEEREKLDRLKRKSDK